MGDKIVVEREWKKLHNELRDIRDDAGKVDSFMVKHVNTKWEVRSARVGLFAEFTLARMVAQRNGAPVWLGRAAICDKNVVQWLADKVMKPPAVDPPWVRHSGELDDSCVINTVLRRIMALY